VDEAAAAAAAAAEAHHQPESQISTESEEGEESVERPLVKGKEKVSAPPDGQPPGVVTRGRRGASKPQEPSPIAQKTSKQPRKRAPPKSKAKKAAAATKVLPKEAPLPPAAPKSRAAVSKAPQRLQKQSRGVTPLPTQPPASKEAGLSPVNLLSPESYDTLKLPERPSPHASKKQKTTPELKAPPKYLLRSVTYYHNEKVDSWDGFYEVADLGFNQYRQKADAVARLGAEEAGNCFTVISRTAAVHASGGPGSTIRLAPSKIDDLAGWAAVQGKVNSLFEAGKKIVAVDMETRAAKLAGWQPEEAPPAASAIPSSAQSKKSSSRPPKLTQGQGSQQPSARAATERREALSSIFSRIIDAYPCGGKRCKQNSLTCLEDPLDKRIHYPISSQDIERLAIRVDANIGTLNEIDISNPPRDWIEQVMKNEAVRKEANRRRGKKRERSPVQEQPPRTPQALPTPGGYNPFAFAQPPPYYTPYAPPYFQHLGQPPMWPGGQLVEPHRKSSPVGSQAGSYTVYDYCEWLAKRYKEHTLLFEEAARALADEGWVLTTIALKSEADMKEVVHKSGVASLLKGKIKRFLDEIESRSSGSDTTETGASR